ncbi:hypothetical protein M0722_13790 [Microbacterium sp. KSW4-16]|uniref:hypothetical protein n=1 Tax=Microbacterium aurugineum TaxID=2851642 RepID=UPI0020C0F978|nr:hypothetical protein [Microbacterium aurugineum]MCK8468267.1 hypothetical protein [Microbacterium aurugineum]
MDDEVIEFLNSRSHASEAARVATYRVYLGSREVSVEVHDAGEGAGQNRYSALAYLSDIAEADRHNATNGFSLGNPDSTLRGALDNVHWWEIESAATSD